MSITFHPHGVFKEDLTLNVAEGNALVPCIFMHADISLGRVPVEELDEALVALSNANLDANTRASVEVNEGGGLYHIDGGLALWRLEQYWDRLFNMLQYCKANKIALEWD